jgi:hypothetical protein
MSSHSVIRSTPPRAARALFVSCAIGFTLTTGAVAEAPSGPGAVFASIEAAALDALHFAAQQQGASQRELGGAIAAVAGGYRYGAPVVGDRSGVSVKLTAGDVAWYYTHGPRRDGQENRLNEALSPRDRRMVDRLDPRHRPLFVRTPSGRVLRYGDGRLAVVTSKPAKLAQRAE